MLPRTFLTQLIPARVLEALRRIERGIWTPLENFPIEVSATSTFTEHRPMEELASTDFLPIGKTPFHWGPKFSQRWFHLALPPDLPPQTHLIWEDQGEATAYINGAPFYGMDVAHRYCPIPEGTKEIHVEAVCIKTGIWVNGAPPIDNEGSRYNPPRLVRRDNLAWSVYHDLRVLLDILEVECDDYQPGAKKNFFDPMRHTPTILRASPLFRRWCARLDAAVDDFDRHGLSALQTGLQKLYADFPADPQSLRAVLTGHAHIDLVWLWPERVGVFKAIHSWATQTRLLEQYPDFKFGYSQPASYAAVAARSPQLHSRVLDLIRAGRWEATGASYLEFDTQLPCGEALLRALRLGQAAFTRLRGTPSTVCWLPDVFGYSGILPQLLRGFGVESFFTTKLSWNTVNRIPHTSFRWKGNDGSEVLAHIVHLHDYNEAVDVRNLREDALHHQQAADHPEFLVPTGWGDGGGGPTEEMCERAQRLQNLAGAPRTEWGGIEEFFQRMRPAASGLPELAGELLFEMHRGVFTTHGELKAVYRALERSVQTLEAAHVVTCKGPIDTHLWERLIFAQFHDYIPGSSIWEVYAEGITELRRLTSKAEKAAGALTTREKADVPGWFNPLPLPRRWIVKNECYDVPALSGISHSELVRVRVNAPTVSTLARELVSDRVTARFDDAGKLTALAVDGRNVSIKAFPHALCAYPDHPAKFEAWDIDRGSLVSGIPAELVGAPEGETGGLTARLRFVYRVAGKSQIVVEYSVTATEPVLRIDYHVDWQDPEMLLKAIFSTDYRGREARYGAPFGSSLRSQWPGHSREEAQWEVPASRWMIVMDDAQSEGLAVITEAKYGFTVRDGLVGVTLLRSALVTGADEHPKIRNLPDRPRHSDLGRSQIKLALGRFGSDALSDTHPAALADTLFTPCIPFTGSSIKSGFRGLDQAPSLLPAWADPLSEHVWILRLHEIYGRRGSGALLPEDGWETRIVAMNDTAEIIERSDDWTRDALSVPFGPYQILSVAFRQISTKN